MLDKAAVRTLFGHLADGDSGRFFARVAEDVRWTVMGTHPLAGVYRSKAAFRQHTFARLNRILKEGVVLRVEEVWVDGDTAVVEMTSLSTARNGRPFNNTYCWVARFAGDLIVDVRAYVDSALVARLIAENEPPEPA